MRKLWGGAVLVGGVLALGLYAGARPAHSIEDRVSEQAAAAVQGAVHGLRAEVRGRDIVLGGLADGDAEHARVMAALDAVPGRRVVRSEAEILAVADPYTLSGAFGPGGPVWTGHVPSEAARAELAGAIGESAAAGLTLAAGAPTGWAEATAAALEARRTLVRGAVKLEGQAIALSGVVPTPREQAAAEAALTVLPEGWTAELDLTTLDDGKPFALDIEAVDGNVTWQGGKLPRSVDPLDLDTAYGAPVAGDITVAQIGEEEQDFAGAAQAGLAALAQLMQGRLRIEGQTLALTGLAADPTAAAAARAELAGLPEGFSPLVELELNDDGKPFALTLKKSASGLQAGGKLPAAMAGDDLAALAGQALRGDVTVARIGAENEVFTTAARAALRAVAPMKTADVTVSEGGLDFVALAPTPAEAAEAEAALMPVTGQVPVSVQIEVEDDGAPFALVVEKSPDGQWTASGKVPNVLEGFDYAAAAGVETLAAEGLAVARIGGEAHGFADAVPPGLAALAALNFGKLTVREGSVALAGEADDPEVAAEAEAALTALPEGFAPSMALDLVDDGTPPAFSFEYTVAGGGSLAGKLPAGMTPPEIAELAGLAQLEGTPGQSRDDETGAEAMRAALGALGPWMGEIEALDLVLTEDGRVSAEITASPGVDGELMRARLAEALGGGVTLVVAEAEGPEGALRDNPATGGQQRLSGGVWLPVIEDIDTTVAGCNAATAAALEGERIGFVTGAFRLDAASFRAVNNVAAVALACAGAGLTLELGGHTDATGNAESNKALSQRRAEVVAAALAARGVPEAALAPVGYGPDQPVAGNDTEEGRAQNRRTTLDWRE
ncbi:OmpA family protein [Vannielia litorea]|uniref:OmpA-OmpF porin, OOP family n=1 Tax=Vannielia litorea TaxID=1217970 RepID=A0A1N6DVA2_9RHOB|nr:OmpA family protein [Vannielia litorea]SIN74728.1 OmpA-OmpF porin, OOP family [Vannielia litorea]